MMLFCFLKVGLGGREASPGPGSLGTDEPRFGIELPNGRLG